MGTRNLSLLKYNNKIIVAQYGQWDGYPSGQGKTILEFCRSTDNIEKLGEFAPNVKGVKEFAKWDEFADAYDKRVDEGKQTIKDNYYFNHFISRDIGGDIFHNIINVNLEMLPDELERTLVLRHYQFDKDSKNYCDISIEYAYLIN